MSFQNCFGVLVALQGKELRCLLISDVSVGNVAVCCRQHVARKLRVEGT